jgi:hypothetical protein
MVALQRCHPTKMPTDVHNVSTAHKLPGRVLLIVSGTLRGSEVTWASLAERVFRRLRASLMLVIAEPLARALHHPYDCARCGVRAKDSSHPMVAASTVARLNHLLAQHAAHVVSVPEYADYADALDLIESHSRSEMSQPSWRLRLPPCPPFWWLPSPLGGVTSVRCWDAVRNVSAPLKSTGSAAIVGVYRWFAKRALLERGLLEQHDWFVYTRTDLLVECELQLPPTYLLHRAVDRNMSLALIPAGEDWGGLYERFIIGTRQAILPALTTVEAWVTGAANLSGNPEGQLRQQLRASCVTVFRIPRSMLVAQALRPEGNASAAKGGIEAHGHSWGGCMHPAGHTDIWRFHMPLEMGLPRRAPVPSRWSAAEICPKYAAEAWLTDRTCNASDAPMTEEASMQRLQRLQRISAPAATYAESVGT